MSLRIAVAGAGLIGRRHVELVRARGDCVLAAIADPAPAARRLARDLDVPWHPSPADLIAAGRPDALVVATPSALHREHALAAIEAGVPVLIEKPIATSAADGMAIARAAAAAGVPVLVGHHRRHGATLRAARRVLDEGVLGRIVAVTGAAMFRKPDVYFDEAPWRRRAGGGPLLINLVHEIDSLRYLCGEIEVVQAIASSRARGFEVEDTAAIVLGFASGVLATFLLSDVAATPVSWELTSAENPAYPHRDDIDCYVIAGDTGWLGVPTLRLGAYAATPSWWEPMSDRRLRVGTEDPLAVQLDHFCSVVRGEAAPLVSALDGAADVAVLEAIMQAASSGSRVVVAAGGAG